jgi:hypothetical protein
MAAKTPLGVAKATMLFPPLAVNIYMFRDYSDAERLNALNATAAVILPVNGPADAPGTSAVLILKNPSLIEFTANHYK